MDFKIFVNRRQRGSHRGWTYRIDRAQENPLGAVCRAVTSMPLSRKGLLERCVVCLNQGDSQIV